MTATRFIVFALVCCFIGAAPARHTVFGIPRSNVQARMFERVVRLAPPAANDSRYAYIPFDVPPRTARITISYHYARASGANTIDIGLFDARSTGSEPDSRGFRGWSGSRRSEFFISRDEATPGYLPGAIPAGKWRIILGLYQVAPAGVDVSLKIKIETYGNGSQSPISLLDKMGVSRNKSATVSAEHRAPIASSLQRTSTQEVRWWRGDLHMHTVHSDGDWTSTELISSARNAGLDFIVITDHNTASHHPEIDRSLIDARQLLVLRGEEITTYGGHANAWGLPSGTWIDFRARPGDAIRISNIAAQAHRAGALISINHPFALCGGCAWSYAPAVPDFDAIEVWNGAWDATDEQALAMWDKILGSGRRLTAIASSDSHRSDTPVGQPTTHVAASVLTQTALLKAIRQGQVYLTGEAAGPIVGFGAEAKTGKRRSPAAIGDEIHLSAPGPVRFFVATEGAPPDASVSLISNGQVIRSLPAKSGGQPQMIEIECQRDSYYRLEVRDKTKRMLALTNPIYTKIRTGR